MSAIKEVAIRPEAKELGQYLANIRAAKRMTLREVEDATDKAVSNAYLSQLENGKINKPSPNILHSLAAVYGIPYEMFMEKAGYINPGRDRSEEEQVGRLASFAGEYLTREEEDELLEYLAFIRSRKSGR